MEVSNISKDDCKKLAEFLNSLRNMVGGSPNFQSAIHFSDGVRWLQNLAVKMAEKYSIEIDDNIKNMDKENFKIKNYSPGASE
jgi:hypothetical protein